MNILLNAVLGLLIGLAIVSTVALVLAVREYLEK